MTVREMIAQLEKLPQDIEVMEMTFPRGSDFPCVFWLMHGQFICKEVHVMAKGSDVWMTDEPDHREVPRGSRTLKVIDIALWVMDEDYC